MFFPGVHSSADDPEHLLPGEPVQRPGRRGSPRIIGIDLRDVGEVDHERPREKRWARTTASLSVEKPGFQPAATRTRPANTETAVGIGDEVLHAPRREASGARARRSPAWRRPPPSPGPRCGGSADHLPQRRLVVAREAAAAADDDELAVRHPPRGSPPRGARTP